MNTPTRTWSLLPVLALAAVLAAPTQACTIFVLTDGQHVLFGNNEDWSNPKTRIWFIPHPGQRGCVFVGFDNGWGQGGMNTDGLAYDWVAGFKEQWERDPAMKDVKGNPAQRMLESCTTVDDAIRFFREHWEPSFSYAKILVGDRSGTSAVIGAKDGRLHVERTRRSCAFGYRGDLANGLLSPQPEATTLAAVNILRASRQEGPFATKYSNVFDLKTGDITLVGPVGAEEPVRLNLGDELKKGGHYFELPQLRDRPSTKPKALTRAMKKF